MRKQRDIGPKSGNRFSDKSDAQANKELERRIRFQPDARRSSSFKRRPRRFAAIQPL
jgi:hypothetical protein